MQQTTDYEITNYGIDNAQYFQGHDTSFTKYADCCVGIGDDYNEALEDALECAAMNGVEILLDPEDKKPVKSPSVSDKYPSSEDECNELYYYVGLRWNLQESTQEEVG